jgi:hypothetical protein
MINNDDLEVIDRFEEKFGNTETVKRACDFMACYLAKLTKPFPPIAAQGLRVALDYGQGVVGREQLEIHREAISDYLREHSAWTDYESPEYCIIHSVYAALESYLRPSWGGGGSELISNFIEVSGRFEKNSSALQQCLEKSFTTE